MQRIHRTREIGVCHSSGLVQIDSNGSGGTSFKADPPFGMQEMFHTRQARQNRARAAQRMRRAEDELQS